MTRQNLLFILLVSVAAGLVLFLPVPPETGAKVLPALALTVFTVGLWATGGLPEYYTSLIFFVLALVFAIAPADVVFSGFRSSAFWLIAGGVVIGMAANRTGLGRFLAHAFVSRLNKSYPQLISGIVFGAVILAFLIPAAIARIIILMPIAFGLADQLGFEKGSKGRTGMVLAVTFGSFFVPLTILPANLPNVVLAGVADGLYDIKITYGLYLLMNFPITGALKGIILVALICFFFGEKIPHPGSKGDAAPRLSTEGLRLAIIVGLTLTVWATDFIHGIAPGWVAIVTAIICLAPGLGVIGPSDFRKDTSFQTLFFVAAVLAVGNVAATSGAGALIADALLTLTHFAPGNTVYAYGVFSGISIVICLFATLPGTIAVLAPFAGEVAEASGLPLVTVLMMLVNGFSTVFFPYQSAPLLIGIRMGGVSIADGMRLTLPLALIAVAVLLPMNFLWWQWLGFLN
ncbi:MAG: anion permease [Rhodospirillales bacterium]|nr:anion permease [Rhodospirillales bacterium]